MISVEKSDLKTFFENNRTYIVMVLVFLVFCGFTARLVDWQIINYEEYKLRANSSNIYFVKTDAIRGEIVDKDGVGFAVNETGYKVTIDRLTTEKGTENCLILQTVNLLIKFNCEWVDILPIEISNKDYSFKKSDEKMVEKNITDLKKLFKLSDDVTANECMNYMITKYGVEDLSKEEQRIVCSVRFGMDKIEGHNAKAVPYVICENANSQVVSVLSEFSSKMKGIKIHTTLTRKYINGEIAPHLVGYTGAMNAEEYEKRKEAYAMDEKIGKTGIEQAMEDFLRGKSGRRMIQMDYNGSVVDVLDKTPTEPGKTVFLTISSKLQEVGVNSLKNNVEAARGAGFKDCTGGAVVVLNIKDFSVLAADTYPSYDLARLVEDKTYYSTLYNDPAVPLMNRAFWGAFVPGSIHKPIVASASLQENKIKSDEKINCNGSFNRYIGYRMHCMGVHGSLSVIDAISKSCNVFFGECGYRLREKLGEYAKRFGIGEKTGVEIGESAGFNASPEDSEKRGIHWYESDFAQSGIGQSKYMITPLQLAVGMATIARGDGNRYKPHIIDKIMDYSRQKVIKKIELEFVCNIGVSPENLKIVRQGMRQVALNGTARDFANYNPPIICKTGTAQVSGKSDHTTFICAAPADDPEIAIAVVIPHGAKGIYSKNVARDMLNEYFKEKKEKENNQETAAAA